MTGQHGEAVPARTRAGRRAGPQPAGTSLVRLGPARRLDATAVGDEGLVAVEVGRHDGERPGAGDGLLMGWHETSVRPHAGAAHAPWPETSRERPDRVRRPA